MINPKSLLLILSSSGMVLTCFYACTSFIFTALSQKPVSVSEATMILLMATLITYIHNQKGWRRISVIGLHLSGFLFASLRLSHRYYELDLPFWRFGWISELFMHERVAAEWPILTLILLCAWILWFYGIRMITRPVDSATISDRFDFGLGYLLFLLLIKLVIAVKGVSIPMEHSSIKPIISYIILGLFSMGLVRTRSFSQTGGIIYLKGAGIVLTFVFITLMLGGGLFILFLPELETLAETSSDLITTTTEPLWPIIIALLRFLLVKGCRGDFGQGAITIRLPDTGPPGEEPGILTLIFAYLNMGMIIVLFLVVSGFILFYLLKWLRSRTDSEEERKGIREFLLACIHAVKRLLAILRIQIFNHTDASRAAEKYYKRLLRWGRFSGLHHADTETPKEYGIRLGQRFPRIEKEIRYIIHMHDDVIYGYISPDGHQISRVKLALKRIRNPLLWVTRIKSLCFDNRF